MRKFLAEAAKQLAAMTVLAALVLAAFILLSLAVHGRVNW